ncbi:sensor histidine kinase [Antarcticirhabdus aurantiaca]|uniref:HAMP domain-containing sensor histidine kinase n=1 Tax=Antarcticirhabdus aurantiaca TaxID=2606717 RepID=A0ACD4NLR8_9HYPH|nr:HAMP domain-containing sensor histidine kinase [Antarcticirhabdus aurantiaca]WAJ27820.1 HAMP domain-containing sensor histidine kinase [Jeongeuplla avenae]
MRLLPRSLFGRMLGLAALTTLAALVFAALAIGQVLERFVVDGLDRRLDAQITVLARALRPDGSLDPARAFDLPDFADPDAGWRWLVDAPDGRRWESGEGLDLPPPDARRRPPGRRREGAPEPRPGEGTDASGQPLHYRELVLPRPGGATRIVAAAPREVVEGPLREAAMPLLLSLALLGAALAGAAYLQLRLGLRPLGALREAVAGVRAGGLRHVPADQPSEIRPLAEELNALIDQNEAGLANARRHVANLAHGLKTPLAALQLRLAEPGRDADGSLAAGLSDIDRRIRHHLARARAAHLGEATGRRTALRPALSDLVAVMTKIHAERAVQADLGIPEDIEVAVEAQDLDELFGNILDNAFRHARSRVAVTASRIDRLVRVTVEDDGPGLTGAQQALTLLPGQRLDEAGDGHGFGLPIAQEIAEMNGGGLALSTAASGGLAVSIHLPLARG